MTPIDPTPQKCPQCGENSLMINLNIATYLGNGKGEYEYYWSCEADNDCDYRTEYATTETE